ncbi:phosphotransferase family protein [Streptosporangium sp. CA-135522]|uniref:phosphotransferase family protein n=1 Tax=Streptosporangium sp. CA-135522 TaxID=3240072 RepID=UPI003D8B8CAC
MIRNVSLPDDWEPRVRKSLGGVLPELRDASLRPLGAGLDNVTLLLNEEIVLRLPKNDDGAESVEREARLLPELTIDLAIPRFLFTAPNPLGPGSFCGYVLVPGEVLSPEQWRARGLLDRPESVRRVAAALDAVHAFPVDKAERLGLPAPGLREDFADDLASIRREVLPRLTSEQGKTLLAAWEGYLGGDANFAYRPTLTHGDVSLDHLLVSGEEITGLIDFGDAEIGDPDYDLSYLWAEAGPEFVRRVQAHRGLPLAKGLVRKLDFWSLADPAQDVVYGLEIDEPELVDDALSTLRARLAAGTRQGLDRE